MIILGLGANLGDRLKNLRHALSYIKQIPNLSVQQVSPIYSSDALLPDDANDHWDIPYFNLALRCETTLSPYELLHHIKEIEKKVGRTPEKKWGPRIIDIDILAWDDLIQYDEKLHVPHEHLVNRPFALWPLADVAPFWIYPLEGLHQGKTAAEIVKQWGSRFSGAAPFHTKQISQRIDTPELMGIINITPDSFSDGGNYFPLDHALRHAEQLIEQGAEILDIGAESTRPNADMISAEEEWQRLEPFLLALMEENFSLKPKISVDTRHAETAEKALALGVDWINDVSGLENLKMCEVLANHTCDIVFMHHLGIPANKTHIPLHANPVDVILKWANDRLQQILQLGIKKERLIFDVGIGFGKTPEQSLYLLNHIKHFQSLGVRLLVGHSRKSFLSLFTDKKSHERDLESVIFSLALAKKSVDYLRVHDVENHMRAFKITGSLL